MEYQFSALIYEGEVVDARELFDSLGFPNGVAMGHNDFVDAINPTTGTRHAAVRSGWTMLTDQGPFVSMHSTSPGRALWSQQVMTLMKTRSSNGRAFAFTMSAVSNSNGFTLFENGTVRRTVFRTFDEALNMSEGEPLPEEEAAFDQVDFQTSIVQLMEMLEIPFRHFETATFASFAFETRR